MTNVHSGMKFIWDAVPGATSYDFQIRDISNVVKAERLDLNVLELTVEDVCAGLVLGTSYFARVRAKDAFGAGPYSGSMDFLIVGIPAPTNLRAV